MPARSSPSLIRRVWAVVASVGALLAGRSQIIEFGPGAKGFCGLDNQTVGHPSPIRRCTSVNGHAFASNPQPHPSFRSPSKNPFAHKTTFEPLRIPFPSPLRGGASIGAARLSNKEAAEALIRECKEYGIPPPATPMSAIKILMQTRKKGGDWDIDQARRSVAREAGVDLVPGSAMSEIKTSGDHVDIDKMSNTSNVDMNRTSEDSLETYLKAPEGLGAADIAEWMVGVCHDLGIDLPEVTLEAKVLCGRTLMESSDPSALKNNKFDIVKAFRTLAKDVAEQSGDDVDSYLLNAARRAVIIRERIRSASMKTTQDAGAVGILPLIDHDRKEGVGEGDEFIQRLNPQQRAVVTAGGGPILVVAGAGTGKTTTLVSRVVYLIRFRHVRPENILLLTFTRKAAQQMLSRVNLLLPSSLQGKEKRIHGGTFHGFCASILHQYASAIDLKPGFTTLDDADQTQVMREAKDIYLKSVSLSQKGVKPGRKRRRDGKQFFSDKALVGFVSRAQDVPNISFEQHVREGGRFGEICKEFGVNETELIGHVKGIRTTYEQLKKQYNYQDYGDLQTNVLRIFAEHPDIAHQVAREVEHCICDEVQDTNILQFKLLHYFASVHGNLLAVGDPDQSIYMFRGAHPDNCFEFPALFPGCQVLKLEENYRSTRPILDTANSLIKTLSKMRGERGKTKAMRANPSLYDKTLFNPRKTTGIQVEVARFGRDKDEARYIFEEIKKLRAQDIPLNEIAVLSRFGRDSTVSHLERLLVSREIPYVKVGGVKLMNQAHVKDVFTVFRILANPTDKSAWLRLIGLHHGYGPKKSESLAASLSEAGTEAFAMLAANPPVGLNATIELLLKHNSKRTEEDAQASIALQKDRTAKVEYTTPLQIYDDILLWYDHILSQRYPNDRDRRSKMLKEERLTISQFSTLDEAINQYALDASRDQRADDDDNGQLPLVLSTVHSAKGLEYHTVFVAQCLEGNFPAFFVQKDRDPDASLEEELRVMYVAVTRAKERLVLTLPQQRGYSWQTSGGTDKPSPFLMHMGKGIRYQIQFRQDTPADYL